MVFSNSIVFTKIDYWRSWTAGTEAGTSRRGRQGQPGVCAAQDASRHINQTGIASARCRKAQARQAGHDRRRQRGRGLGLECVGQAAIGIGRDGQGRTAIGGVGRPAIRAPVLGLCGHRKWQKFTAVGVAQPEAATAYRRRSLDRRGRAVHPEHRAVLVRDARRVAALAGAWARVDEGVARAVRKEVTLSASFARTRTTVGTVPAEVKA